MLQYYGDKYNWNGLEILLAIQKIGKFEENNPGIAINILFNSKAYTQLADQNLMESEASKLTY